MKKFRIGFLVFILLVLTSCSAPFNPQNKRIEVNFILNGGTTNECIYYVFSEDTIITLFTPEKEGYTFLGWKLGDSVIKTGEVKISENSIFEALWEEEYYTICFDLAYDDKIINKKYKYLETITLDSPTRNGYKFLGWSLDDKIYDSYQVTSSVTFKAIWEKQKYEITYLVDGEIYKKSIISYQDEILLSDAQKDGFDFLGWYLNDEPFLSLNYDYTYDITLVAKFSPKKYIITLISDEKDYINIYYNDLINLPVLKKEGYIFLGWYLDDELFENTSYTFLTNITLYAKWEKERLDIIDEFVITLYNTQTSSYDEISIFDHTVTNITSKYWHKIGIKKELDKYKVTKIVPSGTSLSTMGDYDFVILAYSAYSDYSRFCKINDEASLYVKFDDDLESLQKGSINLKVTFYKLALSQGDTLLVKNALSLLYSDLTEVDSDLNLVSFIENTDIKWKSSNIDVIDESGSFKIPYVTRSVTLFAYVGAEEVYSFSFVVKGKQNESKALATGYFYTNFDKITENTIKSLDIMYIAFAYIDETLDFVNMSDTNLIVKNIKAYVMPLAKKYQTKVIISVNQKNGAFSTASSTIDNINKFSDNVISLINKYGFDGVDIDWECPTSNEASNFVNMIEVLSKKVKQNNPDHLLTAAIGGGKWQPPRYNLDESHKYLDYINLMTYSMVSSNGLFQNALYKSTKGYTLTSCSIAESIAIYDSYNVPRSKILVGIAFYGIKQEGIDGVGTGNVRGKSISFRDIYDNYILNKDPSIQKYDEESESAYIYDETTKTFISYDNERSIKRKCEYVNTIGLAGIMYWQDGHDKDDILLNALRDNIRK